MTPSGLAVLGGLSPKAFLGDYWQKQPLLVRGAFKDARNPLCPDELAGLACATELPSRLVLEQGGQHPWEVRHGPFEEDDFSRLPSSHWTLLVQGVERIVPGVAALRAPLSFLPAWRFDDIMVSYASDAGGVGPHVDSYDVFLVQLWGRRRWRIQAEPINTAEYLPGLDLRILRSFRTDHDWRLEPGDLLYLPPGIAHWGVAEGACMTYSIGFRAPSAREVWTGYLEHILAGLDDGGRYRDADLAVTTKPGEISKQALARLQTLLTSLPQSPEALCDWFGQHVTEPGLGFPGPGRRPKVTALRSRLSQGQAHLRRRHGARMAYVMRGRRTHFFALGQRWILGGGLARLARALADTEECAHIEPAAWLDQVGGVEFLAELISLNVLIEQRRRSVHTLHT